MTGCSRKKKIIRFYEIIFVVSCEFDRCVHFYVHPSVRPSVTINLPTWISVVCWVEVVLWSLEGGGCVLAERLGRGGGVLAEGLGSGGEGQARGRGQRSILIHIVLKIRFIYKCFSNMALYH